MTLARLWMTWRQRRAMGALTAEQRAEQEAVLVSAYREALGGERGRIALADILRRGHVMETTYVTGDPYATAFREGRRRLALEIVEMVNRDPNAAIEMARTGEVADLMEST